MANLICVDDDGNIRDLVKQVLTHEGYQVAICNGGKALLELLPDHRPDLILLDMLMPEMDGLETMNALKQDARFKDYPVAFMTARVEKDEVQKYISQGAVGVIAKPIDIESLAYQVAFLLGSGDNTAQD